VTPTASLAADIASLGTDGTENGPSPLVSVVVTVTERPELLVRLYEEYSAPLRARFGQTGGAKPSFEFLFVTQPFYRRLTEPLAQLVGRGEPIRVIAASRSVGEAALLRMGAEHAAGQVVVTLPAYRQVEASALIELIERVIDRSTELAVAWRWPRCDAWINRLQNRVLHLALGRLSGNRIHDVACGVRAVRREVLREIPLYGDFARFLPLLAMYSGYRVMEVPSPQHPSDLPVRVYGPGVYLRRLIDIFGLFFLLRFTDKPLRFFGFVGSPLAGSGAILLLVLFVQRIAGQPLAGRPMLLLSVLLLVLGIQAIALGLIGEMIVHFSASRRRYRLRG
jgi:hypothetical protein